jgi:hypothetical protein
MAAWTYDEALRRLLAHEGGYTNHPSDPGGPTNFGITIHDYRKYVKPNATAADVRAMKSNAATRCRRRRRSDAMWTWLASLIGGPVISGLINAYKAKLAAANTQDRIAADLAAKEIEAEIEARKQASAIIIAEQGRWYTAIIRPLLAFPIIISMWKVVVFDKVLGLDSTDPLTGMIADWSGLMITAYVGGRSIEKVARIFRR